MKRTVLAAAVAAMVAGTAQAAVTEFIIFKRPNYQGDSHVVKGEVANLANDGGFAQYASSLVVRGGYWEVCSDHHFQGDCRVLAEGSYPRLGPALNNKIYSVRFLGSEEKFASRTSREYRDIREARREAREDARDAKREARRGRDGSAAIELYGGTDFRGRSIMVENNLWDLSNTQWDGRASSLIVHDGTWQVCSEPGYQGRCSVFTRGEYRQLAGLDDRISSLRQLR
jgi:hypothetical protein